MRWEFVVALVVAIPIVLVPVAFMWYLNLGGIYKAVAGARKKSIARENEVRAGSGTAQEYPSERGIMGVKR